MADNEYHQTGQNSADKNLLSVFIKYPTPGSVKTRMAADLGYDKSADISRQLSELTLSKTAPSPKQTYSRQIFYHPEGIQNAFSSWLPDEKQFLPQQGKDLGEKMFNAFKSAFSNGYQKVIVIGCDCPEISRHLIDRAFTLLDTRDVVIGPALDGGYYLIGLKKAEPAIFDAIPWGTNTVLTKTLSILTRLKMSYALLPVFRDVDRIEDLYHYWKKGLIECHC